MGQVYTNKSNKNIFIGGGIAAVVVIALVLYFVFFSSSHTSVLKDFYALVEKQDYEGMYQLLDDSSKEQYTQEEFIERNSNIYEGIEAQDIQIDVNNNENDVLSYTVTMNTVAGEATFENKTLFKDSKIVWDDSFIYPTLTKEGRIRIVDDEAVRGEIVDRNGIVLAGEGDAYSVGLVKGKLNGENDYNKIAELLSLTKESIQKSMSASWVKDDSFVPLKTISQSDTAIKDQLLTINGVQLNTVQIRSYPFGKITSHMLGYIQKVTAEDLENHKDEGYTENSYIGRSGIEAAYEKELKGKDGVAIYVVDASGSRTDTMAQIEKEDGQKIELTIDITLQEDLYQAFQNDESASVALNPQTGEVLALVSTPTYNSNDFILGMSTDEWNALNNDTTQPLYNRFRATFVPGSSMKPITGAIGLNTGSLDASKDFKAELRWQKDSSWGSYYVTTLHAPTPNNLKNALIQSDNVYFAKTALEIGKDNLVKGYQTLKIGEEIPFELSLNKSQYTSDSFDDEMQIADSGYGQGEMLMNPVQMASIYSSFVNNGNMMTPHLLKSTESSTWIENAFTQETTDTIKDALIGVVNEGTATAIKMNGVTLAGKTGTGEIKASQQDTTGTEIGWFTVMTTDSSQPIVISTMVEDVKNRGGSSYVVNNMKTPLQNYLR